MKQSEAIKTQLNSLRRELYTLLGSNATFQEVYDVSTRIDALVLVFYKEHSLENAQGKDVYFNKQVV